MLFLGNMARGKAPASVAWIGIFLTLGSLVAAEHPYVCTNTCSFSGDERPGITYAGGQLYKYEYKGEVITKTRVTGDEESKMAVTAEVVITARTECDHKLQVLNLVVEDVPEEESKWFKEEVEKYDLHYSYQDGWMEYLCPHDDEDVAATNFKRGILSALQTTVTNVKNVTEVVVQEIDVSGECETLYQLDGDVFNKTKRNCHYNSHLPYIPHGHYHNEGKDNNLPFFRNDKNCKMELSQGVWKSVECKEEIAVEVPFSASTDASTMTTLTVSSTLTLQSGPEPYEGNFTDGNRPHRRESLRMDLPGALKSSEARKSNTTDVVEKIGMAINQLSESVNGDASLIETRPYAFSNLLDLLGKAEEEDLEAVWDEHFGEEKSKQFLMDALMLCENQHCIRLLANVSQESPDVMPPSKVKAWLTGTHFFSNVDPESINITMELVQSLEEVGTHALMAASTMVYKICQKDPDSCYEQAMPFLDYIEEQVGESCGYGKYPSEREYIRVALRALSNAGVEPSQHFARRCYNDKKLVPNIRVAALQTYRRSGCPSDSDAVWSILENRFDEGEVRVAAYSALVPCAIEDPKFFVRIRHLLKEEEVNQVGSYIWTHIQNLINQPGASSDYHELAKLASHHSLRSKFNTNGFRSSRNYRYAHYSEIFNMGGSAESNVIFTPRSYIPQQASMNFTLDFLEKSINVFEIGGDFSGLEDYIEGLFGKDGYFKHEEIKTLLENMRPKRDIREDKMQEFQRLYDEAQTINEEYEREMEDAKASFYLRVFGNEVVYVDNLVRSNPIQFIQSLAKEFASPKSFKIIDQEYASTTQLGFPLRLKVNATGSISFEHEMKAEKSEENSMIYEAKITASAVVACDESLMVDGYGPWSGVRRRSSKTIHTDLGGKIEQGPLQPFGVQLILSNPEIAKISSSSNVALYNNANEGWQDEWPSVQIENHEYCTSEFFSRILGLEVCAKSTFGSHTVGSETFQGEPTNSELAVTKSDNFPYYQFYFKIEQNIFEAIYEAPGSSVPRKIRFLVNLGPDGTGGYIVIEGMGYGLKGQYKNTDTLKELSLAYIEEETVKGGIEISFESEEERLGFKHTPKFVLTVGPDVFALNGNLDVKNQKSGFKSSWNLEGTHHKVDGRKELGQYFGSIDGGLEISQELMDLQLHSQYGPDKANAHSFSLMLETSNSGERPEKKYGGKFFMETTQGESNITLSYKFGPSDIEASGNVAIQGKEVSSQIVMKNINEDDGRDFQVTLSLASPQFDIDYLGQAVFKVADHAIEVEAAFNFGSATHAKAALIVIHEDNPLLFQAGVHLSYNEYLFEAETSLDLSQPGKTHASLSGSIGPASGEFLLHANHAYDQPFNATLVIKGKYDDQEIGFMASMTSDEDWELFTGSTKVNWFDENYTLKHELDWKDETKRLSLTSELYGVLQIVSRVTSHNPFFQFLVHSTEEIGDEPDFQVSFGVLRESSFQLYESNITMGSDPFFATSLNFTSDQEFSSSLTLLSSELAISGKYSNKNSDDFEGSVDIIATLPSGEEYSSNGSLVYSYDGTLRELEISSGFSGEVISCKLSILYDDSWFGHDSSALNFTLKTPFAGMKNAVFSYAMYDDPSHTSFILLEWEDIKLHAFLHAHYRFEATLQYGDGGTCDSRFSVYHNSDHSLSNSAIILALTPDTVPWSIEFNTTFKYINYYSDLSFGTDLTIQAPVLESPFEWSNDFSKVDGKYDFSTEVGFEEKSSVSFTIMIGDDEDKTKFLGSLEIDSPWTEPLLVNITGNYDYANANVLLDFKSTMPLVQSLTVETSISFTSPGETRVYLQLNHDDIQMLMAYNQKFSRYGFTHDLEGSINTFTITYDSKIEWDYNHKPTNIEGKLSLLNLMDHDLELSLYLKQALNHYVSQVSGLWDEQAFKLSYTLYQEPQEWSTDVEVLIPGYDDAIRTNITVGALDNSSTVNLGLHFNSPWTEGYDLRFMKTETGGATEWDLDILQASSSLFRVMLYGDGLGTDTSSLKIKLTGAFFEEIVFDWQYNANFANLISFEFSYGSDVYLHGKSHVKYKNDWLNQDFISYEFSVNATLSDPLIQFATMLTLNTDFIVDFSTLFNDYSLKIKSDFFNGIVLQGEGSLPDKNYEAELTYKNVGNLIPDVSFRVTANDINLIKSKVKFQSLYPKLDSVVTFAYANEDNSTSHSGSLTVTAVFSVDYGVKGIAKLISNVEGFENLTLSIDTDLKIKDHYIGGFFTGDLQLNDQVYSAGLNASFTMNLDRKIMFELGGNYDIPINGEVYKADAGVLFTWTKRECQLKADVILENSPPWSLILQYRFRDMKLNGYLTLGDGVDYTLFLKLDSKILHINLEIVQGEDFTFKILQGNINWNIRQAKQQINMNFKSDYPAINKITGQLTIRGMAATLKILVNEEKATVLLRLTEGSRGKPNKLHVTVESDIVTPISTVIDLSFLRAKEGIKVDLTVDWNEEKGWITANLNGGFPESYLRFVTPFEGFDKFNLTVIFSKESEYSLNVTLEVPQFCFSFETVFDRFLRKASVGASVNLECSDTDKYEFLLKYNVESLKEPLSLFTKLDLNGYSAFEFDGLSHFRDNGLDMKAETTLLQDLNFGSSFSVDLSGEKAFSLNLRAYDPPSNETHFSFETSISKGKTYVDLELLQDNTMTFKANYDFSSQKMNVSSKYSHMLFSYPFSATFSCAGSLGNSGGLDIHFETDKSYYDMDLSAAYEFQKGLYGATFNFTSPTGNVTAKALYDESMEKSKSLTIDMLSTLHTFYDYHYELVYQGNSFKFVSAQDDVEFELQIELAKYKRDRALNVFLSTPYETFKTFNVTFVHPEPNSPRNKHKLGVSVVSNGDLYMVDIDEEHDVSWKTFSVEANLFTPYDTFKNTTLYLSYDTDGQLSLGIDGRRGRLGLKAVWNILRSHVNLKATFDLSYFQEGEFIFDVGIPLTTSQAYEFRMKHQKSNNDFDFEVAVSERSGLFSVVFLNPDPTKENVTYSLQYVNDGTFSVEAHIDRMLAMFTFEMYGYPYLPMAGKWTYDSTLDDHTVSYETTWDISQQGSVYKAEVQIDDKENGLVVFDATLDSQANYAVTPWDSVKLDILFESPHTLSHHFHAEYQLRLLTFSASYKYGLDTFYINGVANVHPSYGTITLISRLPVYGLSSFDFRLGYTMAEQSSFNLMISVEETTFETSFAMASERLSSSFKASLTSPFINPLGFAFTLSHSPQAVLFELKSHYGGWKGSVKMNLKYTDTFVDFELEIVPKFIQYITSLKMPSRIAGLVKYDITDPSKMYGGVVLTADDLSLELKSDFAMRRGKVSLNVMGLADLSRILSANVTLSAQKNQDAYEIDINGDISGLKPFNIHLSVDTFRLEFLYIYNSENILDAAVSYDNAKVNFYWDKNLNFNITAYSKSLKKGHDGKSLKRGHEVGLEFMNHEMQTITVQAWYVQTKGNRLNLAVNSSWTEPFVLRAAYQGNRISLKLAYGEKEYNVSTRFLFRPDDQKATIDVEFDSSEDPLNPLSINAFLNLKDFMVGRMTSLQNITSISVKWGDTTDFVLQGLRKPNYFKLVANANTPFDNLPNLSMGVEWELVNNNRHFLLDFDGYIEWSEKISLEGLTKISKDLRLADVNWSLKTPFVLLNELSAGVQWKEGHAESMISYNNNKWKVSCDYKHNPFYCSVSLETPIPGYETITSTLSVDRGQKIEIHADLTWPGTNTVGITLTVKRLMVEVGVITPWAPFKKVLFYASIKSERDKAVWSGALQWDERRIEISVPLAPSKYRASVAYFVDTEKTGFFSIAFAITVDSAHFEAEMMTPFDVLKKLEVLFDVSHRGFSLKLNLNDAESTAEGTFTADIIRIKGETPFFGNMSGAVEISRHFKHMSMYVLFLLEENATPYNASFTYKLVEYPFSFKSAFEIKSDETLVSALLDVVDDLTLTLDVLENYLELKFMSPRSFEHNLHVHFDSENLQLQSMNFDLNANFGKYFDVLNITSTLTLKLKDQFLSRHEFVLQSVKRQRYIYGTAELFSDYFSDPYKVKVVLPLHLSVLLDGEFDVSVKQGTRQLYRLYHKRSIQYTWSFTEHFLVALPDWEANLILKLDTASLSVSLSYSKPLIKHTFQLKWTDDISLKKFSIKAKLISSFLDDGDYNFNLEWNFQNVADMELESELIIGTHKVQLQGHLSLDESSRLMKFEAQFVSNFLGSYSVELKANWEDNIVIHGKLILQDTEHNVELTLDFKNLAVELALHSPALSQGDILIRGSFTHYYDTYSFEGVYKSDQTELVLEGNLRVFSSQDLKLSASVRRLEEELFSVDASFLVGDYRYSPKINIHLDITSELKELNTYFDLYYVSDLSVNRFGFEFNNYYLLDNKILIDFASGSSWLEEQIFTINIGDIYFSFESNLGQESTLLSMNASYQYKTLQFSYQHNNFGRFASVDVKTSFSAVEALSFRYDIFSDSKVVKFSFVQEGKELLIDFLLKNDRLLGKALTVDIVTPFKGYEKMKLLTPQTVANRPSSYVVGVEYPSGKIWFESVLDFKSWNNAYVKIILCLPFENHEIVSLQYVLTSERDVALEARIGKFGFTFSFEDASLQFTRGKSLLLRLNDYVINVLFRETNSYNRRKSSVHADIQLPEIIDLDYLDLQVLHLYNERAQILLRSNREEYLNLHYGWESYKVFTVATPKWYPGYVHVNFENADHLDDYRVEVGVASGSDMDDEQSWDVYGFQIHQDILSGGRSMRITSEALGGQISLGGTLSLDSLHFNHSLVFELNRKKLGFDILFQKQPGFFTDLFIEDISVILPNQTIHLNTSVECRPRQFDLSSRFTWSEYDIDMPPITLDVTYDDNSLFDEESRTVSAVFNHPEVDLITFNGNITKLFDTPLNGLGEIVDLNAPDRNIIMTFTLDPISEDGEQNLQVNISQAFSNFSLTFEAQVGESIFREAEYSLKYWSLSQESLQEVYVSTMSKYISENQIDFVVDVFSPESEWGYNYEIMAYCFDSMASISLQGISKEFNDYWVLGATATKYLPELEMSLQIGQEGEEPFETGRLRAGLFNPLDVGISLDHQRFGIWEEDAHLGLNLKTPSILQFLLKYDPSLDHMDDNFVARLTSPADQILSSWSRDVNSTISNVKTWIVEEMPFVKEALINQETLDSIWMREEDNIEYLKIDFMMDIADMQNDFVSIWTDVLLPAWTATYEFAIEMYTKMFEFSEAVSTYFTETYSQVLAWFTDLWTSSGGYLTSFYEEWSAWFIQVFTDQWSKIVEKYNSTVEYLTMLWTTVSESVIAAFNTAVEELTNTATTVFTFMKETAGSLQALVQPYVDATDLAFTKYGAEIAGILREKCFESLQTKANEFITSVQEVASGTGSFFTEFLQFDEFYNRFVEIKDKVVAVAEQLWTTVEGALSQLQQSIIAFGEVILTSSSEAITQIGELYNNLYAKIETDGLSGYLDEKFSLVKEYAVALGDSLVAYGTETFETLKASAAGNAAFDYVSAVAGNLYEQLMMVWNRWRHEERKDLEALERVYFSIADAAENFLVEKNYLLDELYVWKLEDYGRVEYNQLLPLEWNTFLEVPNWHPITRIFHREWPIRRAKRSLYEGMFALSSGWQALSLRGSLTPPFTATATIFGHHVTTFDLHHYQFLGSCTYLLSKDFVGKEFEIFGNYHRSDVGHISLHSLQIRTPDADVQLFVTGNYGIRRRGSVEVYSGGDYSALKMDDLFVTCNKETRGCAITVSGKYFGRLGGLLGNFNYEPSDDSLGPDGARAHHPAELGSMWAVSYTCYQANQIINVNDFEEAEDVGSCWDLFLSSSSPFSSCFHRIDPRPYFDHCIKGQNQPDFGKNIFKSPCDAVGAYRTQCSSGGIHLPALEECQEAGGTCTVFGESVPSGWNMKFRGNTAGSADVAFVVEVANCNKNRNMNSLLAVLNSQFEKNNIVDARYTLVVNNKGSVDITSPFVPAIDLASRLNLLRMTGPPAADGGIEGVLTAAKKLNWRPGVARTIIQLSCDACQEGDSVEEAMRNNDVTYHLLARDVPNVQGPDAKKNKVLQSKIFGYDENFVYKSGDYRKLQGDADDRELVVDEEGSCAVAAQKTNGTFFNSLKWNPKKRTLATKFLDVLAQRVVQSSVSPKCQECRCTGGGSRAVLSCRQCSSWKTEGPTIVEEDEPLSEEIKRKFVEFYQQKRGEQAQPQSQPESPMTSIPEVLPETSSP